MYMSGDDALTKHLIESQTIYTRKLYRTYGQSIRGSTVSGGKGRRFVIKVMDEVVSRNNEEGQMQSYFQLQIWVGDFMLNEVKKSFQDIKSLEYKLEQVLRGTGIKAPTLQSSNSFKDTDIFGYPFQ